MDNLFLVFDVDGTLLHSEELKLRAFEDLFIQYGAKLAQIQAYSEANRGVPREDKFRYICQHILASQDVDAAVQQFMADYKQALAVALSNVEMVSGVRSFLDSIPCPKAVTSAAPIDEVRAILEAHQLTPYFQAIHGYPDRKADVLTRLKAQHTGPMIFFGDAWADYEAAQQAQVHFIGVETAERSRPFADLNIPTIPDFEDTQAILNNIRQIEETHRS